MFTSASNDMAVIGCGELGSALIQGVLDAKLYTPEHIHVFDVDPSKMRQFDGINACASITQAVESAGIVFLALRPQDIGAAMKDVSLHDRIIVSMVAGVSVASLQKMLTGSKSVLRTMPNIALKFRKASTAYAVPCHLNDNELQSVLAIFRACGTVEPVAEELMDIATAVNGSGPAYFAYFIDAIAGAAVNLGMGSDTALRLTLQTVISAVALLEKSDCAPEQLLKQIASPGGTTGAALSILEAREVYDGVQKAVAAAVERAHKLSIDPPN